MIIYFSGAGNSRYIARRLARLLGDRAVSMEELWKDHSPKIELEAHEDLGFVMPVHFGGMPAFVHDFMAQMEVRHALDAPIYIYGVPTFGASVGEWEKQFKDALRACGLEATGIFPVRMVDTYVPLFDVTNAEKNEKVLEQAERLIPRIAESIQQKSVCLRNETNGRKMNGGKMPHWMAKWQYKFYESARRTKRFSVDSHVCEHCGACAANCPTKSIDMSTDEHLPIWTKEKCTLCLRCLHHCPAHAIRIGRHSEKHGQYPGPEEK
ncbi:MAG: EFR1 family ferrodoxin [Alloprevotella sp.]